MKWIEVRIETTTEASDAVSEMLTSVGAGGVAIEDPEDIRAQVTKSDSLDYADEKFLEELGDHVVIKAYFNGENNPDVLVHLIKEKMDFISQFLDVGKGHVEYKEVDDQDWANSWKKYYKPFYIAPGIVIKPTWESYQSNQDDIVIELDPGMAFGTGTHETTRMCAVLLKKYVRCGDTVFDVGCGSGILSIIAAKLGAKQVSAVDVDQVAVDITKENSVLNRVDDVIEAFKGSVGDIEKGKKARIIVANIIAKVIIDIAPLIPDYLEDDGYLLVSGIIRERRQEVAESYAKLGFTCMEVVEDGEWVAMALKWRDSL